MDRTLLQRLTLGTIAVAIVVLIAIFALPGLRGGGAADTSRLDLSAQPRLGEADAPVEIVLFEDFRCPSCATFTERVYPGVVQEFVRPGTAQIYFVNFPVLGAPSRHVAEVAECVSAQSESAFWDMKAPLMRSQGELDSASRVYELVSTYAPGVDMAEVRACVEDDRRIDQLNAEIAAAQQLGVTGTPTVMVDGERVNATLDAIRARVEQAAN